MLLWNRLMGTTVYDCGNPDTEGAHLYCHSRRDGEKGVAYLVINNSLTETTAVHLPKRAERYTLRADALRSATMRINGLPLTEPELLRNLPKQTQAEGNIELEPGTCIFFVL